MSISMLMKPRIQTLRGSFGRDATMRHCVTRRATQPVRPDLGQETLRTAEYLLACKS
jgi:hypothetical protein